MTIRYGHECRDDLCPVHKLDPRTLRRVYSQLIIRHFTLGEQKAFQHTANQGMLPDEGHKVLDEESIDIIDKVSKVARYYAEEAMEIVARLSEMEGS